MSKSDPSPPDVLDTMVSEPRPVLDPHARETVQTPVRPGPQSATALRTVASEDHRVPPPAPGPASTRSPLPDDRFEDRGEIGRGGMGTVRHVRDQVILRRVAMKIVDDVGDDGAMLDRFLEEARITGQLDHANIVPIYDIGFDSEGRPRFFTMKLVEGRTLTEVLADRAGVPSSGRELERTLQIFIKVCDAVGFAHSRGVVHRDLKPDNIMVGSHGQVYLMDWGIAKLMRRDGSSSPYPVDAGPDREVPDERGRVIGTVAYMAPEQARGETDTIDERTDIYGLGAILYQILTCVPPHLGERYYQVLASAREGNVEPPATVAPGLDIPPGLSAIALKALAADPANRYQTVSELASDIEEFLRGGGWFSMKKFGPGEVVVSEGEASDLAYIIVAGVCEAFKTLDGEEIPLREMGVGEVFGEAGVFTSQPRTASVRAMTELTLKVVTRDSLQKELSRNTWMGAFVKALAERFVDVDRRFTEAVSSTRPSQREPTTEPSTEPRAFPDSAPDSGRSRKS